MARLTEQEVIKLIDENHKKYMQTLSLSERIIYRIALFYVKFRNKFL